MIPKFRFFDKGYKIWLHPDQVWLDETGAFRGVDGVSRFETVGDDLVVMQSTGLKDKNGTEIFEGDVVRCTHRETGIVFLGVVKYDNKYGFWGVTDKRYNDLSAIPSKVTYKGYISETTFCEVLGNIHEHPDLKV